MSKQPPTAPVANAIGPCPTIIQIVGRPGTGSLPSAITPPNHPARYWQCIRLNYRSIATLYRTVKDRLLAQDIKLILYPGGKYIEVVHHFSKGNKRSGVSFFSLVKKRFLKRDLVLKE